MSSYQLVASISLTLKFSQPCDLTLDIAEILTDQERAWWQEPLHTPCSSLRWIPALFSTWKCLS